MATLEKDEFRSHKTYNTKDLTYQDSIVILSATKKCIEYHFHPMFGIEGRSPTKGQTLRLSHISITIYNNSFTHEQWHCLSDNDHDDSHGVDSTDGGGGGVVGNRDGGVGGRG